MKFLVAVSAFLSWAIRAFVVHYLWMWFAVPLGAPPLSASHASGIIFLVGQIVPRQRISTQDLKQAPKEQEISDISCNLAAVLTSCMVLGMGWVVVHAFPVVAQ